MQRSPFSWLFLVAPNVCYLVLMILVPLALVVGISFQEYSSTRFGGGALTLDNYRRLLDPYYLTLFTTTLRVAVITTVVTALLAYPVAYFLARSTPTTRIIGMFLIIAPLMISVVVRTYGWVIILGRNGLLNQILRSFGIGRVDLLYTEASVLMGLVQVFLPFMVLPLVAAIERIPPALEEAAQNLGASWFLVFRRVLLPMSLPGLISGAILTFSISVSAFVTPQLLGGPRNRMITQQIYEKVLLTFNLPEATAVTVVMVALTATLGATAVHLAARRHTAAAQR